MEPRPAPFVDSHLHLDHLAESHPHRIVWLRDAGCTAVAWAFAHGVETRGDLDRYLAGQAAAIDRIAAQGLPCHFLTGVHPRNIPPDLRPEQVRDLVLPRLDHPRCRGIGEIGLEEGSAREAEIFEAHLELAAEVEARGQAFGVHTPRGDKARVTRQVLAVLSRFPAAARRAVVDHCTPETAGWVLGAGLWAGVTLSPVKCSAADLAEIVARHPRALDRVMLNSDSGTRFFDDLWRFCADPPLDPGAAQDLCRGNAARFFGCKSG
ncbi:MAG: TatD family hydrolase [Deferrisomatales bacterium]